MADSKISELLAVTGTASADLLNIVQVSTTTNKKITVGNFLNSIVTPVTIDGGSGIASLSVKGTTDTNLLKVNTTADKVLIGVSTVDSTAKLQVEGNVVVSSGIVRSTAVENITATGSITIGTSTEVTIIDASSISVGFGATLGNGSPGQKKTICMSGYNNGSMTLSSSNRKGWNNIIFNGVGDNVTLMYNGGYWYIVGIGTGAGGNITIN